MDQTALFTSMDPHQEQFIPPPRLNAGDHFTSYSCSDKEAIDLKSGLVVFKSLFTIFFPTLINVIVIRSTAAGV